jgi:hypothetical protein
MDDDGRLLRAEQERGYRYIPVGSTADDSGRDYRSMNETIEAWLETVETLTYPLHALTKQKHFHLTVTNTRAKANPFVHRIY